MQDHVKLYRMSRGAGALLALIVFASMALAVRATSPESLSTTVAWLSDPSRSGRSAGSAGAEATADYLLDQFRRLGLEARFQPISPGLRNVIGRIGSQGPHLIVGAHFDGQGRGYPSASDNAAGVAVLLQLARQFVEDPLPVSVVFIAFDDEENGLNGSRFYVQNPVYPLEDVISAVILDTMGRSFMDLERWTLLVLGTEISPELASIVGRQRDPDMVPLGTDLIGARSDFAPFAARRIPYLFFSNATHQDYHGTGDTPDRLHYDRLDEDTETIRRVIADLARLGSRPTYRLEPTYPDNEGRLLIEYLEAIQRERPSLATSYQMLFEDLAFRLRDNPSRQTLRLTTTVLLSAATPRLSAFSLTYLIGPFYEADGNPALAIEVYREALDQHPDSETRAFLTAKLATLGSESLEPQPR